MDALWPRSQWADAHQTFFNDGSRRPCSVSHRVTRAWAIGSAASAMSAPSPTSALVGTPAGTCEARLASGIRRRPVAVDFVDGRLSGQLRPWLIIAAVAIDFAKVRITSGVAGLT